MIRNANSHDLQHKRCALKRNPRLFKMVKNREQSRPGRKSQKKSHLEKPYSFTNATTEVKLTCAPKVLCHSFFEIQNSISRWKFQARSPKFKPVSKNVPGWSEDTGSPISTREKN